ncbi:MAG: lysostaphin resistance A-like protein [Brevinematales bacterium]
MRKIERFPFWAGLVAGGVVLFGIPVGLSFLWRWLHWNRESLFLVIPLFQFLVAMSMFFLLEKGNLSREAALHLPEKPVKLVTTIVFSWVSILMMVSGVVFSFLVVLNALSGGRMIEKAMQDIVYYQANYGLVFDALEAKGFLTKFWLFVNLVFLVPMTEEWLFRGLLYEGLSRYFSKGWSIVLQALIFASLHPWGFYTVLYVVIGLLLGWFRARFFSLWPGIWAHQFQNMMAFFSFLVGGRYIMTLDPSWFGLENLYSLLPFTLLMVGISAFLVKKLLLWPVTTAIEG